MFYMIPSHWTVRPTGDREKTSAERDLVLLPNRVGIIKPIEKAVFSGGLDSRKNQLDYSSIRDDGVLVDDDDSIMNRVHLEVAFRSLDVVDTDTAVGSDSGILVDDGPLDDGGSSDTNVRNSILCIVCFFFFAFISGSTHAVYTIKGSTGFNECSDTDD